MKQKPYRNESGHIVMPSPGATVPEAGWPFEPLTDEEIIEAGGDPELYRDDDTKQPSLFDKHPLPPEDDEDEDDDE